MAEITGLRSTADLPKDLASCCLQAEGADFPVPGPEGAEELARREGPYQKEGHADEIPLGSVENELYLGEKGKRLFLL